MVGPTRCVLVVDDEPDILESLKLMLETSLPNVRVAVARSGGAGVDILKAQAVDLVISDYRMPGMNGLEFLGKAQEIAPAAPRILITAFPKLEVAVQAINEVSIDKFLIKPIDPVMMLKVVEDLLAVARKPAPGPVPNR